MRRVEMLEVLLRDFKEIPGMAFFFCGVETNKKK